MSTDYIRKKRFNRETKNKDGKKSDSSLHTIVRNRLFPVTGEKQRDCS